MLNQKKLNEISFPIKGNFIPNASPFVEIANYIDCTRERIIWPIKNFSHLIPHIADKLNEVTRHAFWGRDLGTDFITAQLKHTKFLDIYRDKKSGEICQFVRLDVYEEVPNMPISIGIFKLPGYSCEVRNSFGKLALRELSDRVSISNPNPSVVYINCAFSPRGYEISKAISNKITPDIDLIYESIDSYIRSIEKKSKNEKDRKNYELLLKNNIINKDINSGKLTVNLSKMRLVVELFDKTEENSINSEISPIYLKLYNHIIKNICFQKRCAVKKNNNIDIIIKYYINKMKETAQIDIPFVESKSTLIGCIPVSEKIVFKLNAHDRKITDFFHAFLNIQNGDMFLFYSEISYDELNKKCK